MPESASAVLVRRRHLANGEDTGTSEQDKPAHTNGWAWTHDLSMDGSPQVRYAPIATTLHGSNSDATCADIRCAKKRRYLIISVAASSAVEREPGCRCIASKRVGSSCRSSRSTHLGEVWNRKTPTLMREAEVRKMASHLKTQLPAAGPNNGLRGRKRQRYLNRFGGSDRSFGLNGRDRGRSLLHYAPARSTAFARSNPAPLDREDT